MTKFLDSEYAIEECRLAWATRQLAVSLSAKRTGSVWTNRSVRFGIGIGPSRCPAVDATLARANPADAIASDALVTLIVPTPLTATIVSASQDPSG